MRERTGWLRRNRVKAELLEEYVTGVVLDALESPRCARAKTSTRRAELLEQIRDRRSTVWPS
jgi:hypothetical protein